jgi:hypothetical protein
MHRFVQAASEAEIARLQASLVERTDQGRLLPALADFTQDTVALYITASERSVADAGVQQQALCTLCSLVPRFGLEEVEAKRRCRIVAATALPWIIRVLARHPAHAAIAEHALFLLRRVSWASEDRVCMLFPAFLLHLGPCVCTYVCDTIIWSFRRHWCNDLCAMSGMPRKLALWLIAGAVDGGPAHRPSGHGCPSRSGGRGGARAGLLEEPVGCGCQQGELVGAFP